MRLTILLAAMMAPLTLGATSPPLPSAAVIARLARQAMADTGAKGLAIAVVDRGQVASVQSFGIRNPAGDPLTTHSVMYGASLTKAVFGYLVTQLAEEGKIGLDTPIAQYLPLPLPAYGNSDAYGQWGDLAGDARWRQLTARMILNHATGFANFAFLEPDGKLRFHFDPGARYAYSGEGIMLLQFVLERGLGLDVEAELQRRFFVPLGLRSISLRWQPRFAADLADGWNDEGKVRPHDERSRVRAAGSMDSSVADLAQMVAAMVRGQGLTASSRAAFARGTLPITSGQQFPSLAPEVAPAQRPRAAAALGVIAFDGPQGAGYVKGGHDDFTANTMVCLERRQRCVLIMANDVRAEAAFPRLVDAILGDTGVPYRWEYPALFKPAGASPRRS